MATPQIDPVTGERVQAAPQIDPTTGERITAPAPVAGAPAGGPPGIPAAPAPNMAKYAGNLETIPSNADPGVVGGIKTAVHNVGARVGNNLNALAAPIIHPLKTGSDIIQRGGFPLTPDAIKAASYNPSGPDAGATAANLFGDAATAFLTHKAGAMAPPALDAAGSAAQDTGATLFNKTGGMQKADFKRGANGGRAYLDAGGGPAWSMQGLADQASALKSGVGSQIGDMRKAATSAGVKIPTQDVAGALQPAIAKGIDLETGAGGGNNTGSIEDYSSTFRPTLQAGIANGGITPSDLFDVKDRIAKNTNWGEPGQYNLKAIRQANAGALSGLEAANIPEIAPLKTQYQGLRNFAARTGERASTGSMPLTSLIGKSALSAGGALAGGLAGLETGHSPLMTLGGGAAMLAADSVPVKTTVGSGLYGGGGLLKTAGGILGRPSLFPPTAAVAPYALNNQARKKNNK